MGNPLVDKKALQVSGNTVLRYRAPPNEKIAKAMTQYIHDYKTFKQWIPDARKGCLIEATQGVETNRQSTNRSNSSAALGALHYAELGGSPDEPGLF